MTDINLARAMEIVTDALTHGSIRIFIERTSVSTQVLRHYCSLDACGSILSGSVWLSHAEYSNDEDEINLGRNTVRKTLEAHKNNPPAPPAAFIDTVLSDFDRIADDLDVYIWCLSDVPTADFLSQWRAYGADGRGACVTVEKPSIDDLCLGPLRLNPVIYDATVAVQLIQDIVDLGYTQSTATADIAAALLYVVPLIKDPGFAEEREWRLLYAQTTRNRAALKFRSSGDLYVPFYVLDDLLRTDPLLREGIRIVNALKQPHRLSISEVMVGPSRHKALNARSLTMKWEQSGRPKPAVAISSIPYRR